MARAAEVVVTAAAEKSGKLITHPHVARGRRSLSISLLRALLPPTLLTNDPAAKSTIGGAAVGAKQSNESIVPIHLAETAMETNYEDMWDVVLPIYGALRKMHRLRKGGD